MGTLSFNLKTFWCKYV